MTGIIGVFGDLGAGSRGVTWLRAVYAAVRRVAPKAGRCCAA